MTDQAATLFVCISCRRSTGPGEGDFDHPGPALANHLREALGDGSGIGVVEVECLAVCKRPCTIALTGAGKWTYVIGDLDIAILESEIVPAARAYAASGNGIVPWKERPASFRKGVISRVPPNALDTAEANS